MQTPVVTRFPPSPTGNLQIGNIRTALFNYLYARKHGGKFVVRIEDTDRERSKPEYEASILADLEWLGFAHDAFARQSDRTAIHQKYLEMLVSSDKAYVSKEPAAEGKRDSVIRFRNPNRKVTFTDLVRGEITMDTTDLGDFVIAKDFTEPLYHLAVVVDDYEMGITHVIRGEDHISNTPRQILFLEAIGAPIPTYAHLPLVLAADRSKLSKRNGSVSLEHLRNQGYLKDAVINFLALLGWNPGTEQELFTLDELIEAFDLSGIQKSGGIFNIDRLNWYNREYVKQLPEEERRRLVIETLGGMPRLAEVFGRSPSLVSDALGRVNTILEIRSLAESGEFSYCTEKPSIEKEKLPWKGADAGDTRLHLTEVCTRIESIPEDSFSAEAVKAVVMPYAEKQLEGKGKGLVLWPMRYALSGRDRSPDPFTLSEALGRNEALMRLQSAVGQL